MALKGRPSRVGLRALLGSDLPGLCAPEPVVTGSVAVAVAAAAAAAAAASLRPVRLVELAVLVGAELVSRDSV